MSIQIEDLEKQIKRLTEENGRFKHKIAGLENAARSRCSGCGDYLDGPHHSFCGEREFG